MSIREQEQRAREAVRKSVEAERRIERRMQGTTATLT